MRSLDKEEDNFSIWNCYSLNEEEKLLLKYERIFAELSTFYTELVTQKECVLVVDYAQGPIGITESGHFRIPKEGHSTKDVEEANDQYKHDKKYLENHTRLDFHASNGFQYDPRLLPMYCTRLFAHVAGSTIAHILIFLFEFGWGIYEMKASEDWKSPLFRFVATVLLPFLAFAWLHYGIHINGVQVPFEIRHNVIRHAKWFKYCLCCTSLKKGNGKKDLEIYEKKHFEIYGFPPLKFKYLCRSKSKAEGSVIVHCHIPEGQAPTQRQIKAQKMRENLNSSL